MHDACGELGSWLSRRQQAGGRGTFMHAKSAVGGDRRRLASGGKCSPTGRKAMLEACCQPNAQANELTKPA